MAEWRTAQSRLVRQQSAGLGIGSGQLALAAAESDVRTAVLQASLLAEHGVVRLEVGSESPLGRHHDVLATREFVLAAAQSLHHVLQVSLLGAHGEDDLADVHAGNETHGLSESLTHTRLQTICACARQHFVDAQHVEGVQAHAQVERVLSCDLGHVLVDHNTAGLERLGRQLLVLAGHEVHAQREVLHGRGLAAHVIDLNLGVRNSAAEARLNVRLVLAVAVAFGRAASHFG